MTVTEAPARFRDTGIEAIGHVPWGTHFCVFYETKEDLIDLLVPYFTAGVEGGEYCMWVTSEPLGAADARQALAASLHDVGQAERRGAIEILPHSEWYLDHGVFESGRVLTGWVDRHDAALARGFAGLRLTGNTFWLERSQWRDFQDYEAAVNEVIGRYQMIALCTYSLLTCNAHEIIDVLQAHQFALIKREGKWVLIESSSSKQSAEAIRHLNEALEEANGHLAATNHELEVANRNLESFSYSVSHDLRAPLRSINGYAQVLGEDHAAQLDEEGRRLLGLVQASAAHMAELIDDILAFSLAGRTELAREVVDMRHLVDEVVAEHRRTDPAREVDVSIGLLEPVTGDPRLLRQVWSNLLENAFKFTATSPDAHIDVSCARDGDRVTYRVRDNGVGFDMAYADKLFGVFQRLHGAEFPGTGVGLAIVERIVERHEGSVWGESEVGRGATFAFTLPAAQASQRTH